MLDAIKLHVDAKRYLCHADPGYYDAPLRRLEAQPGAAGRRVRRGRRPPRFLAQPGARDAVLLRQWDDLAKQAALATPSLAHFLARAGACAAAPRP